MRRLSAAASHVRGYTTAAQFLRRKPRKWLCAETELIRHVNGSISVHYRGADLITYGVGGTFSWWLPPGRPIRLPMIERLNRFSPIGFEIHRAPADAGYVDCSHPHLRRSGGPLAYPDETRDWCI